MSTQYRTVIGVRPIKMRPLVLAMAKAFMAHYETRIFPELATAILLPVERADVAKGGLVLTPGTNIYTKG